MQTFTTITEGGVEYVSRDELFRQLGPNSFQDFQTWYATMKYDRMILGGQLHYQSAKVTEYMGIMNPNINEQVDESEGGETTAISRT